ncbi:MAG TPA: hypothetical protein VG368_04505 [Acidimicrobiales bacterium]|nr:hypothetical protein [Acidimicrobiales bacterium]
MSNLARAEGLLDDATLERAIAKIEASLPIGVRPRQLPVRTFLVGVACCLSDGRPAHLIRVHEALCSLPDADRWRLGVLIEEKGRTHELTYRQTEYLNHLLQVALGKPEPDGTASERLQDLVDALVDASVPDVDKGASSSLALDWTDVESFAHPPGKNGISADLEAAWGHRRGGGPGEKSELFFGHYANLATMVKEEEGDEVPELVRQMTLSSCRRDPVGVAVAALVRRFCSGELVPGDLLTDSGYAHRVPERFALPLRAAGAKLVMDLHPSDRGTQGTFAGAILSNGNCYCPATPTALFALGPLSRGATEAEIAAHDDTCAELSRYKLGPISADDKDGYHRVSCPATAGKLRCPARPRSMALSYAHPTVLAPPEHPPVCCCQRSITVPPTVNAKTRQKHDYPGRAWRRSYARRSAVERSNSRIKDPATIDIEKGWWRVMGLVTPTLFLAVALCCRNLALVDAFETRQAENERRHAAGLPPKTRRRRRKSLGALAGANAPP